MKICLTLIFLSLQLIPSISQATETDQFTYSSIPLRDIAASVNQQMRKIFQSALQIVNSDPKPKDLQTAEYAFSEAYTKVEMHNFYFSSFESCILYNNCEDWPKVDRIFLRPDESFYGRADYNYFTNQYLAPTFQLCGVRMGADKLTHIFNDAFRFYQLWVNEKKNLSDWDMIMKGLDEENAMMGKLSSEVVSFGDIQGNMAGLHLFRDLFYGKGWISKNKKGEWTLSDAINICEYISPLLDERNSYRGYVGTKTSALLVEIQRTKSENLALSTSQIEAILKRNGHFDLHWRDYAEVLKNFIVHPVIIAKLLPQFFLLNAPQSARRHLPMSAESLQRIESLPTNLSAFCDRQELSEEQCRCTLSTHQKRFQHMQSPFELNYALESLQKAALDCSK